MVALRSLLVAAVCLASSFAASLSERQSSDSISAGLLSVRSASPIHFEAVNASGSYFWIFNQTNTFCPVPDCSGFPNTTIVTIYNNASSEYQVFMSANVPGGQNVYVRESGALSFTEPHEEYVFPAGSYTNGFSYATNENNITFLSFGNGGATGWLACPESVVAPTSYQVFANVFGFNNSVVPTGNTADCLGFSIIAEVVQMNTLGAFQYE